MLFYIIPGFNVKHLTARQIDELKAQLGVRTRDLATRVREELAASQHQHYRDLAGMVTDTADEALARALVDVDTAIIDRHIVELRDIEAARERLRLGTYGICIDCGDDVVFERLAVYPTAKRCVHCQQQHEHGYAHQNTPRL
jgi:DnaK suppressor protein